MFNSKLVLLCVAIVSLMSVVHTSSEYPTVNPTYLKKLFDSVKPYTDLSNAFYSVKGLSLLGENVPAANAQELCTLAKTKMDKTSLESIYYASSLSTIVGNCQLTTPDFQAALAAGASSQNVADIYHYVLAATALKMQIDVAKVSKNLNDGLKADSSILNQAYALHIATHLTNNEKSFHSNIDDLIDQADEVDNKYLQYEGGVGTTSLVLEGIFLLSEKVKQFPTKLEKAKLLKFVNYLSSKRQATNIKSAFYLLRAAIKLSDNTFSVPIVINRVSSINVLPTQANLVISVTDLLGRAIKGSAQFTVEAESAKSQTKTSGGPTLFATKKAFTSKSSDGSIWEVKLLDQAATADFYTVAINVAPKTDDKRFFLVQKQVEVKVTTIVDLVDIQVGVVDRDQSSPKLVKLQDNQKLKDRLEADQQSKFYLKFAVKDKTKGALIEAHQAFVRFTAANGRDIVFLAQATVSNQYSADVDFSTNAKNFRHSSGIYSVELIVSDSLIDNPIALKIADIRIQFGEEQQTSQSTDKSSLYSKKPEIKHLFRQPDPTPPKVVSNLFAILCLLPLALLFILWIKIGANVSKFSFSLSGIAFHISLAAIFVLFYFYWIKLDMFQTLRYLALIGGVTFVTGNKMLKNLASFSKEKKN